MKSKLKFGYNNIFNDLSPASFSLFSNIDAILQQENVRNDPSIHQHWNSNSPPLGNVYPVMTTWQGLCFVQLIPIYTLF